MQTPGQTVYNELFTIAQWIFENIQYVSGSTNEQSSARDSVNEIKLRPRNTNTQKCVSSILSTLPSALPIPFSDLYGGGSSLLTVHVAVRRIRD
ncbi:MAG: hypothetical protein QNL68_20510 [Akkermansiaceae bacterium]|jgi:hypothetical protein